MNDSISYILNKSISRYDNLIESVNTKVNFIIGFNTFLLGSIVLKSSELLSKLNYSFLKLLICIFIFVIFGGICATFYYCFQSVKPYLKSGNVDKNYKTLLFFDSVSKMKAEVYLESVKSLTDEFLIEDLSRQVHTLSNGLSKKYRSISRCFWFFFWFELIPITIMVSIIGMDWLLYTISIILNN